MRIACVRHASFEGPAAIGDWAATRGHTITDAPAPLEVYPPHESVDMLCVMGGPMGAYEEAAFPWLVAEKAYVRAAIDAGALVLGVCLGAQVLAEAIGGRAHRHVQREIGWFPVSLTSAGRASGVFREWPATFVAGQWHGDTFDLPESVPTAASSNACPNQAFETAGGRVVGLQFHLEWTPEALADLVGRCADTLTEGGPYVQTREEILGDAARFEEGRALLFDLLDRMEASR